MPIRIRVYPQNGYRSYGGHGNTFVRHARQRANLQLRYERALFNERLRTVQMQAALRGGGLGAMPFQMPFQTPYQSPYQYSPFAPYGGLGLSSGVYGASFLPGNAGGFFSGLFGTGSSLFNRFRSYC